jgi:hypothetical protein
MGKLFSDIMAAPGSFALYGYIPLMAGCSPFQLGALNSESFCERVFSEVNNTMTTGNTLLNDQELQMLTLLRINRDFIAHMKLTHPHLAVFTPQRPQHDQKAAAASDADDAGAGIVVPIVDLDDEESAAEIDDDEADD